MTTEQHPIKSERLAALPPAEKAKFLFDRPTCPDRAWTDECRLHGETRDAFIRRIVLRETDNPT